MIISFPNNPDDGMIFEAAEGIFYQFKKTLKSWVKVDGFTVSEEVATPLKSGLMSSEDLRKINALLMPPPKTTITSPQCSYTFNTGVFGFRSSEEHLHIEHELVLRDKNEQGFDINTRQLWRIHENTYGINFRLNINKLVTELESRGQLNYKKTMGPRGSKGLAGADGIDNLQTGPKGLDGDDGTNWPFSGNLSEERNGFLAGDGHRGIIDIRTEEVSEEENYLIVTRANIGNAELCPARVRPQDIDSKWVVAIDERPPHKIIVDECFPTVCNVLLCEGDSRSGVIQTFCSTRLYFLDIRTIEDSIQAQFESLVAELKETKEKITLELMKAMIDLFTEQKLSLCCAIENCESRRENQRHRNHIDAQRIQAAQFGHGIYVDGEEVRSYVDTNIDKDCPPELEETEAIENESTDSSTSTETTDPLSIINFVPTDNPLGKGIIRLGYPPVELLSTNEMDLAAGEYEASFYRMMTTDYVIPNCFYTGLGMDQRTYEDAKTDNSKIAPGFNGLFRQMEPYNRRFKFYYQTSEGEKYFEHPDCGNFKDPNDCFSECQDTPLFNFTHSGGKIRFEYTGHTYEMEKFDEPTIFVAGRTIPFKGGFSQGGGIALKLTPVAAATPTATDPLRQECEPFETTTTLEASKHSFKFTRQHITNSPQELIEVSSAEDTQTGSPLELTLPSAGTFEITMLDGSYYDAKVLDAEYGLVCLEACTIRQAQVFRILEPGEIIPSGWTIVGDPPETEERFTKGFLVTKQMYDEAINDNNDAFNLALKASGDIVSGDNFYNGLENANPNEDIRDLMERIRNEFRPYDNSRIAVKYTGFVDADDTEAKVLFQSFEDLGGFQDEALNEQNYQYRTIRITVSEPTIQLHINEVELQNQDYAWDATDQSLEFNQPAVIPNVGNVKLKIQCVPEEYDECAEPLLKTKIDCKFRDKEPNALVVTLDPGEYVATISNCCCFGPNGYEGRIAIRHDGIDGEETLSNARVGDFDEEMIAQEYYIGNSFAFKHLGGDMRIWVPEANMSSGTMELEIQTADCFNADRILTTDVTASEEEVSNDFVPCDMPLDHLNFYEFGWQNRACCGAHVQVGGVQWLVVKRSVGTDATCGGGESWNSNCMRSGAAAGIHPAIAFPTIDGQSFFGKPTSGFQRFFRESILEESLLAQIKSGDVISSVNNPGDTIDAIIFPYEA